jgi:hypothetical protein
VPSAKPSTSCCPLFVDQLAQFCLGWGLDMGISISGRLDGIHSTRNTYSHLTLLFISKHLAITFTLHNFLNFYIRYTINVGAQIDWPENSGNCHMKLLLRLDFTRTNWTRQSG